MSKKTCNHILGYVSDCGENIFVYKSEFTSSEGYIDLNEFILLSCDTKFNYCPECGEEL